MGHSAEQLGKVGGYDIARWSPGRWPISNDGEPEPNILHGERRRPCAAFAGGRKGGGMSSLPRWTHSLSPRRRRFLRPLPWPVTRWNLCKNHEPSSSNSSSLPRAALPRRATAHRASHKSPELFPASIDYAVEPTLAAVSWRLSNIVPTTVMMQLASMLTKMFLKIAAFHFIVMVVRHIFPWRRKFSPSVTDLNASREAACARRSLPSGRDDLPATRDR